MTVPAETLREWAAPCSSLQMTWTRAVVSDAVRGAHRLAHCEYEVFLQGSFANNTHISPVGDVDIVVMMTLPLEEDLAELDAGGRANFAQHYEPTDYNWRRFRDDVAATMRERYFVGEGKRCLDIKYYDSMIRVPADVLPAIAHRHYESFVRPGNEDFVEGVLFYHRKRTPILNFPKQHRINGQEKERRTRGRSKEVVRVVKNARDHIESIARCSATEWDIVAGVPSYYLECLVHRVPDRLLRGDLPEALRAAFTWLVKQSERPGWKRLKCQNEIVDLFGDGPDRWDEDTARNVVTALDDFFGKAAR
jgi:hypothetical protein